MYKRQDQKPGDYSDPGWFKQPAGTQAFEWTGSLPEPARFKAETASAGGVPGSAHGAQVAQVAAQATTLVVRKPGPGAHAGH